MTANLALVLTSSVLVAAGVYLLLERSLTRVLIGIILISNGVNIAFLVAGGRAGGAPIVGVTEPARMSDSLPQAMVLTAIVITLGITAFLLAMAYRSWQLTGHDEVQDDVEDAAIRRLARADAESRSYDDDGDDDEADSTPRPEVRP
jgi:multicomponent Na+:H+ antiporter subunit C